VHKRTPLDRFSTGRLIMIAWATLAFACAGLSDLAAGVSPENVIVVVNSESIVSRTVANHYIQLRDIPSTNVVMLEGVPSDRLKIDLDLFKSKILLPVLRDINARGLARQARVIAYSADFPTSIDISPHTEKLTDEAQKKHQRPTASISGLTFFYRFVLADDPAYLGWYSNLYCRGPFARHFANPFAGEKGDRFSQAVAQLDGDQPAQGAVALEKLFDEHPFLSSIAIRAAEGYAEAGDRATAKKMIERAVTAGWRSATYLRESDLLSPLLSEPEVASLMTRLSDLPTFMQPPVGFAADRGWTSCGHSTAEQGQAIPYLLSCSLAVVHPRGSTAEQAVEVFQRSASADRSFPDAAFWFTRTGDVRTTTRFPLIGDALLWLQHLGQRAELIHAAMPNKPDQCVGLMLGTAKMTLPGKDWSFVAGAVSDNLTSFSGRFDTPSQTKMTELLHAGAAMTSGPVDEPFAIQAKFPLPMMYGYYAAGVTAIEAFYLSVSSPYQLLILGDPLTQPFARAPRDRISVELMQQPNRRIRIRRRPVSNDTPHTPTRAIEFFVEGKWVRATEALDNVDIELPEAASGTIGLRVVLVGDDATEPRSWFSEDVDLSGPIASPLAQIDSDRSKADAATVRVSAAGADAIELMHHMVPVAVIDGDEGTVTVTAETLGSGPVRLRPVARFGAVKVPGRPLVVRLRVEAAP
jgi:uncharacterized protein (TIGR03790 family)